jgi:hypothetical protein
MDKARFEGDTNVKDFVAWLSQEGPRLPIHLKVKKSRFVPVAINAKFVGIENTVPFYSWKSAGMATGDWAECSAVLQGLSNALKAALAAGSNQRTLDVCKDILAWGGNRAWDRGAWPFLQQTQGVSGYLQTCRVALDLSSANIGRLAPRVLHMNSMLTKVHALASDDGLPIYDSRVAAAIAVLVELWRRSKGLWQSPLPDALIFPSVYGGRSVLDVFGDAVSPGVLTGIPTQANQWASAKVRLGWLMQNLLTKNNKWFADEPSCQGRIQGRMHAFEAALFMLGYDVTCLISMRPVGQPMMGIGSGSGSVSTKVTSPLSGNGNTIRYSGSAENGFKVIWGASQFTIHPGLLASIVAEFSGHASVPLGASRTNPAEGSFGYWLDLETQANSGMASAIAAILVNEGYASMNSGTKGRAIYLKFD